MPDARTLIAQNISKGYPGVQALQDVSITVRAGKLTAILGENGAGKSTLMRIIAGEVKPDTGAVCLDESAQLFSSPRDAQAAGIVFVHQELNLIENLSIAENLFLGREPTNRFGLVDYSALNERASAILERLQLAIDPRTKISNLRVGQKQLVEIGKAIATHAQWLILDEPTSAITNNEVDTLFQLIAEFKRQGIGILYITHKMDELPRIADEVAIMRDGKLVTAGAFADFTMDEMIRLMVGRDPAAMFTRKPGKIADPILRVEHLGLKKWGQVSFFKRERLPARQVKSRCDTKATDPAQEMRPDPVFTISDWLVRDVSFEVARGEVLGIFGLMGAGRTELLETIAGLHPHRSVGNVMIDGQRIALRSPREAIRAGIVLAPEDRKRDGLVLGMSVRDNINLASMDSLQQVGLLSSTRQTRQAAAKVEQLNVKTPSLGQPVRLLSGGNQQKVVLAKWLATRPRVLLLDEPTRGIDIHAKTEIYNLLSSFAAEGLAVVMVSSELPELLGNCDRILVMCQGSIAAEFSRQQATEEALLREAFPKTSLALERN